MPLKSTSILATLFGLGFAASAQATVLVNTLGNNGDSQQALTSSVYAESFVTSGTGDLGDVEVELSNPSTGGGSIVVTLRADNGSDKPISTALDTIYTVPAASLPTGQETLVDFYNLGITGLAADTRYWIEIARSVGTSPTTDTYTTTAPNSPGTLASNDAAIGYTGTSGLVAGDTSFASGGTASTISSGGTAKYLSLCVSDDNSCDALDPAAAGYSFNEATTVPEPASLAIFGVGLTAVGFVRRRRVTKT